MKRLNRQFRGIDECTDVLSFSPHPVVVNEQIPADSLFLGDLVMATRYIHMQCKEDGIEFQSHLTTLLVHGVCHLLGYDHEKDEDYKVMHRREQMILLRLKALQKTVPKAKK